MENKEKNFVSAVIYVHNAQDRVGEFLHTVIDMFENCFEQSEIICMNDGSVDNSLECIREAGKSAVHTSITIVNMSYFHGLEVTMNAGVELSIGDFVFEFDSTDLNFDKIEILNVYYHSLKGYDIVSAIPDNKEKRSSRLFYKVFSRFSNQPYQMHTESFRILSRRVINRISSMNKTVPYRKAIYVGQGLKTDSIIYKSLNKNVSRQDKQEKIYRFDLAVDALLLFTQVGYRFSIEMTFLMMVMSVFMMVYSIVIFATSNPVAGWTTTILFLSVVFFGLFGILTIVIKYLQLIVNLVFKRKQYNFEGIERLTK
jgi:dolichol-phosphate mannosyltransferase